MKSNRTVPVVSLLVLTSMALTAQVARQQPAVPLKNWSTPQYWIPNQAEREAVRKAQPQLTESVSASTLNFVATTPCRLVDTRGIAAGFNGIAPFSGPSITAAATLTIPVQSATEASTNTEPAPCGVIPSTAQGYSLNITVVPAGGGRVNYISLWPAGESQPFVSTLDDPQGAIVANAAIVAAGSPTGGISVYNAGPATADVIIDMNGYFIPVPNSVFGSNSLSFSQASGSGATCTIGSITLNASSQYPDNYLPADGRLLSISTDPALFSLIGINYGGNGTSNFALPNLTSAAPNNTQYLICTSGIFP